MANFRRDVSSAEEKSCDPVGIASHRGVLESGGVGGVGGRERGQKGFEIGGISAVSCISCCIWARMECVTRILSISSEASE